MNRIKQLICYWLDNLNSWATVLYWEIHFIANCSSISTILQLSDRHWKFLIRSLNWYQSFSIRHTKSMLMAIHQLWLFHWKQYSIIAPVILIYSIGAKIFYAISDRVSPFIFFKSIYPSSCHLIFPVLYRVADVYWLIMSVTLSGYVTEYKFHTVSFIEHFFVRKAVNFEENTKTFNKLFSVNVTI